MSVNEVELRCQATMATIEHGCLFLFMIAALVGDARSVMLSHFLVTLALCCVVIVHDLS